MLLGFLFGIGFSILFLCGLIWREAVKAYDEANR